MARWMMRDAVAAMNGQLLPTGGLPEPATFEGIAFDSRSVAKGELFFALSGEQTDGHRFVAAALAAGAAAAVVERLPEGTESISVTAARAQYIQVADTFHALHDLTRWVRSLTPEKLIGITGSAGKTTTKKMLTAMLAPHVRVAASPGNLNNLYGFPKSLLGIPADSEWMVAEMGMSTPGELGGVSELGRPDVAVFTNVRLVHLEAFDREDRPATLRDIAHAKSELLRGLSPEGLVVANVDDPEVVWIAESHCAKHPEVRVVWYSGADHDSARLWISSKVEATESGITFVARERDGRSARVNLPVHGAVNAYNFLAAATCALELGIDLDSIADSVSRLDLGDGRGRLLELDSGVTVIDDTYNSNPDALQHAALALLDLPAKRRVAVIGEMRELGRRSAELHREAGERLLASGAIDHLLAVGPEARPLAEAFGSGTAWAVDAQQAAKLLLKELREGDLVLVKGSRGVGLEAVVDRLVHGDCGGVS